MDHIMFYVGCFTGPLSLVLLGLLLWHKREVRRDVAFDLCVEMEKWGLGLIAKLLKAYTIGNYLGKDSMGRTIRKIVADIQLHGLPAMLEDLFWKLLAHFLKATEKRDEIRKQLEAADLIADAPGKKT